MERLDPLAWMLFGTAFWSIWGVVVEGIRGSGTGDDGLSIGVVEDTFGRLGANIESQKDILPISILLAHLHWW